MAEGDAFTKAARLAAGGLVLPVRVAGGRRSFPPSIRTEPNWTCMPPEAWDQWVPTAAELMGFAAEGAFLAQHTSAAVSEVAVQRASNVGMLLT